MFNGIQHNRIRIFYLHLEDELQPGNRWSSRPLIHKRELRDFSQHAGRFEAGLFLQLSDSTM